MEFILLPVCVYWTNKDIDLHYNRLLSTHLLGAGIVLVAEAVVSVFLLQV